MPSWLLAPISSWLMFWRWPLRGYLRSSMMSLSGRLLLRISLSQKVRSCSSPSLLANISSCRSSSPSGCLGLRLALPSDLPFRLLHPPMLSPLPLAEGRGTIFEGSLPPLLPQVGNVLGQHWHAWQSCGANKWTVEVLRHGCRVSFHHLPLCR